MRWKEEEEDLIWEEASFFSLLPGSDVNIDFVIKILSPLSFLSSSSRFIPRGWWWWESRQVTNWKGKKEKRRRPSGCVESQGEEVAAPPPICT